MESSWNAALFITSVRKLDKYRFAIYYIFRILNMTSAESARGRYHSLLCFSSVFSVRNSLLLLERLAAWVEVRAQAQDRAGKEVSVGFRVRVKRSYHWDYVSADWFGYKRQGRPCLYRPHLPADIRPCLLPRLPGETPQPAHPGRLYYELSTSKKAHATLSARTGGFFYV